MEASIQIVRYQEVGLRKIRKQDGDRRRLGLVESRGSISDLEERDLPVGGNHQFLQ